MPALHLPDRTSVYLRVLDGTRTRISGYIRRLAKSRPAPHKTTRAHQGVFTTSLLSGPVTSASAPLRVSWNMSDSNRPYTCPKGGPHSHCDVPLAVPFILWHL